MLQLIVIALLVVMDRLASAAMDLIACVSQGSALSRRVLQLVKA